MELTALLSARNAKRGKHAQHVARPASRAATPRRKIAPRVKIPVPLPSRACPRVTGTEAEVHARIAVATVRVSPTKPKGKGRLAEVTDTRAVLAAGGALFANVERV